MRSEVLPVVFAENSFCVVTRSNLRHRSYLRKQDPGWPNEADAKWLNNERKAAGTLGITSAELKTIRKLGNRALFRNIRFDIYEHSSEVANARKEVASGDFKRDPACSLKFSTTPGRLASMGMETSMTMTPYTEPSSDYAENIKAALEDAKEVARKIMAREAFLGFSLVDLDAIAKAFRFEGFKV